MKKIRAFTLLECLVALFVISGSVLVLSSLTTSMKQQIMREQRNTEKDWQIFCSQIRSELSGSQFVKVENNFLYVKKGGDLRFGSPAKTNDFRKTNANGQGYQPMLFHVKSSNIKQNGNQVDISVTFDNGEARDFLWNSTN